ncbi:DUF739 family protein [Tannerella forsythia]|jgi:hypothetical protein|uniref:DUF739 family protein n=1 Tax=Tannerella forsythia TaxID=28112 RepID=UPI0028F15046|nr:DUF739 family protein [Tannerella forsythia]
MVFDYRKLRGQIIEHFGTQKAFAEALGVSTRTLSLKLNSRIPFTQDEIAKAINLLQAEPHDIKAYFFTTMVQ